VLINQLLAPLEAKKAHSFANLTVLPTLGRTLRPCPAEKLTGINTDIYTDNLFFDSLISNFDQLWLDYLDKSW
jgi:hypothetical protein